MVQAIIMAGGEGSRLRPLTCDRPKPMVPVANRPVMEYIVRLLKKYGISDIGVTLQYLPQEIINYFNDGSEFGVKMRYYIEDKPLGTAGSVKNASQFLNDTFIVISGDALTDFDLSKAIEFHRQKGALATLVLTPVGIPLEYGVVITGEDGRIRQFLEKPGWGEVFSDTVNTGIYILEPEVLKFIPEGAKHDFSQNLFPKLLQEEKPIYGVIMNGYWCDIGNVKQYQEAHYAIMDGKVSIPNFYGAASAMLSERKNCQIDPTAVINEPVIIGENCRIGRRAVIGPYAVLGNNSVVDDEATVKRTVVWKGSYLGKKSELRGAVICNRVTVKDRASVFEGAVIGDHTVLEDDVRVRPDTKIWPYKVVEKGTSIENHLVWGNRACRTLFGANGIKGFIDKGLTPECLARIGAAFGTLHGFSAKILVSSDGNSASKMLKDAFQAGLMSVGVNVIDGGSIITPVHQHSLRMLNIDGGVHIRISSSNNHEYVINLFNKKGHVIDRNLERKIENLYERDDFQRASNSGVGSTSYMPNLTDDYLRNLLSLVKADEIKQQKYKIVLACLAANMSVEICQRFFENLGCIVEDFMLINMEKTNIEQKISDYVVKTGSDLGIAVDRNGENALFIDKKGTVIKDEKLMSLLTLIFMEKSDRPVVTVPVTGSKVIDIMAKQKNGKVIRTKTAVSSFLKEASQPEVVNTQGQLNQAVIVSDAFSMISLILEYMTQSKKNLSDIINTIPQTYMTRKKTDCPWSSKGTVIRKLIEENKDKNVELLDGVKIYDDKGWALILPDPEDPSYNVFTEGYNYEFAESLSEFYIDKINQLKQED